VPFLSDSELVRATDKPYSERYFTNLRESAKIAQQFQAAEEKEDDIDRGADQEQQEVSHSTKQAATIDGAETRARSVPKQLEHQLGERQEQEEQNTDEPLPEVHEIASNTGDRIWPEPRGSNTQRSVQDAVSLSGQSDEAESAQHQRPNSQQLNRANLKELGYNQTQAGIIVAGPLMSVRLTDMRPEPTSSPPAGSSSEVQRMCLPRLRIQSINLIHKTILLPLLRKSSLKHFSLLVLAFSRMIYTPEIGSLRDLELLLTSNARVSRLLHIDTISRNLLTIIRKDNG
jgi:hypothetical protein